MVYFLQQIALRPSSLGVNIAFYGMAVRKRFTVLHADADRTSYSSIQYVYLEAGGMVSY